jgi:hypothetical protein
VGGGREGRARWAVCEEREGGSDQVENSRKLVSECVLLTITKPCLEEVDPLHVMDYTF